MFIEVITNVPLKKSKTIIRSDICRFCMVGDRPVDLVSFSQEYHYVPNCTAEGLEPLFCTVLNDSSTQCEPYFSRMAHIQNWRGGGPAIRQEVRIVMYIVEVKRISHLIEMGFYYGTLLSLIIYVCVYLISKPLCRYKWRKLSWVNWHFIYDKLDSKFI